MKDQNEITWEHRGILVDWLLQVHARFSLQAESLFLCINVLDRFLGSRPIAISKLQLVGLTCFFIATKYEETYAPSVKEITYLADDQYTTAEILTAERYILRTIEWDLRAPGPLGWLRRASKADDCELHARTISKYLLEIGCVERRLIGIVPSLMAAAAIWLARLALGREKWVGLSSPFHIISDLLCPSLYCRPQTWSTTPHTQNQNSSRSRPLCWSTLSQIPSSTNPCTRNTPTSAISGCVPFSP